MNATGTEVLRPLWPQIYLPNLVMATGQGAMLTVLALDARHLGASSATASAVVAANGFGTMLFDLPSGRIVARIGEVRSGWAAVLLLSIGITTSYFATSPIELGTGVFVAACGWAIWSLVRLTHLSRVAPVSVRGRALSIFGGVTRAGNVIGPFVLVVLAGSSERADRRAFALYLGCAVIGFIWLIVARERTDQAAFAARVERIRPLHVLRESRREFATAGVGSFGIQLLRASRQAVIPLWGAHLGFSLGTVALIFGLSNLVDLAMFYPAGIVSDRFGRKMVAVPCIVLLSLGHVLLPFTHAFTTMFLVAILLGFGNGLGSGIVMTLGADRAPDVGRASVLAVWRFVGDAGGAAGPLVDAAAITAVSLAAAGPVVGVLGFVTAWIVGRYMTDPSRNVVFGALETS